MKLEKSTKLSFGWAGILLGAFVVLSPACGGGGNVGGECAPNEQKDCKCTGGKSGFQQCNSDGTAFSECDCSGDTGGSAGAAGTSGAGGSITQTGQCGDGVQDSGECDSSSEFYCPQDCVGSGGSGGTMTTSSTNTCQGVAVYAGMVAGALSQWGNHPQANGKTGYEAGIEICKTIGADHPCEYMEVKAAEAAGELVNVAQGTTAWLHRTTIGPNMEQPGPGGRCNDWTYATNHISDGEYVTFDMVGQPAYHIDNDTFYDGVDTTHVIQGDFQCGGTTRNIMCCFPMCVP